MSTTSADQTSLFGQPIHKTEVTLAFLLIAYLGLVFAGQ